MRNVFSPIIGLATGIIVILFMDMIEESIYTFPDNFDFRNKEALKQFIENPPAGKLLLNSLGWALASFLGGLVSTVVSKNYNINFALIIGLILFVIGLINLITFPHPVWFWIVGLAVYFPFAYAGGRLGIKLRQIKSTG
ncbi:MAG: hypothetical protein M3R36_02800 [Bacteroidota bacterium]|nr:hypothetical protein [Bacteroidota bacterium]